MAVAAALAASAALLAPAGPAAARGTGGFLRVWTVCGPLPGTDLEAPDLPADFLAYPGLFQAGRVWMPMEAEPQGRLNLRARWPETESAAALLFTYFRVPRDGDYILRIGSDDAVRVEVDGRTVLRRRVRRAWRADQDRVKVHLAAGWHRLLVRVVNYQGEWAASVRLADARDRPIEVPCQAECPEAMAVACGLDEPADPPEEAALAAHLAETVARLQADLATAAVSTAETPPGYVAFAEFRSARSLARRFFEAMGALWAEAVAEEPNAERARLRQHEAESAARGFSEVLARETTGLAADLWAARRPWRRLGEGRLSRRALAETALRLARLIARTRTLAERIESERLQTARFENDIRNWRQRPVVVRVCDADGRPVAGAAVEIVQQRADFPFGGNLFAYGRWDKKNPLYEQRFAHLFNTAVVPLYWSTLEGRRGRPDYGPVDRAVRWCRSRGIRVLAHALVWTEAVPRWVERLDPAEAREALRAHLVRTIERYRRRVDGWVLVHAPAEPLRVGRAEVRLREVAEWAREADPQGALLVTADDPAALPQALSAMGPAAEAVAAVGLTAHQHAGAWSVAHLRRGVRTAAETNRPVWLFGITLLGDPSREAEQAEAVRHFYTAAFAQRAVAGLVWWDLADRFAWQNAPAGLLRDDLSPKPAYRALEDLLLRRWRSDLAGRTGPDGRVRARVFFGTYRLTARADGLETTRPVHLGRDGPAEVTLTLPPSGGQTSRSGATRSS